LEELDEKYLLATLDVRQPRFDAWTPVLRAIVPERIAGVRWLRLVVDFAVKAGEKFVRASPSTACAVRGREWVDDAGALQIGDWTQVEPYFSCGVDGDDRVWLAAANLEEFFHSWPDSPCTAARVALEMPGYGLPVFARPVPDERNVYRVPCPDMLEPEDDAQPPRDPIAAVLAADVKAADLRKLVVERPGSDDEGDETRKVRLKRTLPLAAALVAWSGTGEDWAREACVRHLSTFVDLPAREFERFSVHAEEWLKTRRLCDLVFSLDVGTSVDTQADRAFRAVVSAKVYWIAPSPSAPTLGVEIV